MGLAPWCANEKWQQFKRGDKTIARVTGRDRCPEDLKKSWVWRFQNTYEQQLSEAPWFHPELPEAERESRWLVRNPFQNAGLFVWGVADRNYEVEVMEGRFDLPMLTQRNDIGEQGFQRARLTLEDGTTRDWFSFTHPSYDHCYGCQPSGIWEFKYVPRFLKFW